MVKPIPDGYSTVTPYLTIRGAAQAIEFYQKAFGAEEHMRMPMPDGRLAHAEIRIGGSFVFISDEFPEMGGNPSPQGLGGTTVNVMLYLKDVDATFNDAVAAGATVKMPPTDMFWGDRFAKVTDPFGHDWALATHKEDLTPEQIGERMAQAFSQPCGAATS
jgi:PhnB protein